MAALKTNDRSKVGWIVFRLGTLCFIFFLCDSIHMSLGIFRRERFFFWFAFSRLWRQLEAKQLYSSSLSEFMHFEHIGSIVK